jgi:hypothetical protein
MASGKIDTDKLLEYAKTLKNRNRVSKLKSACKIVLKNTRTMLQFSSLWSDTTTDGFTDQFLT